jgi:hypothetical protein
MLRAIVTANRLILLVCEESKPVISLCEQYMKGTKEHSSFLTGFLKQYLFVTPYSLEWFDSQKEELAYLAEMASFSPSLSFRHRFQSSSTPGSATSNKNTNNNSNDNNDHKNQSGNGNLSPTNNKEESSQRQSLMIRQNSLPIEKASPAKNPSFSFSFKKLKRSNSMGQKLSVNSSARFITTFEVHVYETLFSSLTVFETESLVKLTKDIESVLSTHYQTKSMLIPLEAQSSLRHLKHDLSTGLHRIDSYITTLNTLTEDDDDMALMYLTLLKKKPELFHFHEKREEIVRKHHEIEVSGFVLIFSFSGFSLVFIPRSLLFLETTGFLSRRLEFTENSNSLFAGENPKCRGTGK